MRFILFGGVLALLPSIVLAQDLKTASFALGEVVNLLIPIAIAIALLYFIWGLAQYILKSGEKEGREGARDIMVWGIIALFVIVAVWGIVQLLSDTFDIDENKEFDVPGVDVKTRTAETGVDLR